MWLRVEGPSSSQVTRSDLTEIIYFWFTWPVFPKTHADHFFVECVLSDAFSQTRFSQNIFINGFSTFFTQFRKSKYVQNIKVTTIIPDTILLNAETLSAFLRVRGYGKYFFHGYVSHYLYLLKKVERHFGADLVNEIFGLFAPLKLIYNVSNR